MDLRWVGEGIYLFIVGSSPFCPPRSKAWECLRRGAGVCGNLCALSLAEVVPTGGGMGRACCSLHLHRLQHWMGHMGRSCWLFSRLMDGVGSNQEVVPSLRPGTVHALLLLVTVTPLLHLTMRPCPPHLAFHFLTFNFFLCIPPGSIPSILSTTNKNCFEHCFVSYRHSGFMLGRVSPCENACENARA